MPITEVCPHVYQVGGGRLSQPDDCCVYLVDGGNAAAIIDTGAGASADHILNNITAGGIDLGTIKYIIVTHGHIDHIGGLPTFKKRLGALVVAHQLDFPAIEEADPVLTAASWYGVDYPGVKVDIVLPEAMPTLPLGAYELHWIHIPGHTPGSIAVYADIEGQRVLFGQDVHGPFNPAWGSDPQQWHESMEKLLQLKADVLCEGHFGIFSPAAAVENYIEGLLHRP